MGLSPTSSRGSGGTFNGGTITEKLSVTPAAGDTPYIGAAAPSGAGDLGDSMTELIGEGDGYFGVDALGTLYSTSDADGGGQTLEHGTTSLRLDENEISLRCQGNVGVAIHSDPGAAATIRALYDTQAKLGFYGVAPVDRAAHPTTLADVITLLTNLGLCQ